MGWWCKWFCPSGTVFGSWSKCLPCLYNDDGSEAMHQAPLTQCRRSTYSHANGYTFCRVSFANPACYFWVLGFCPLSNAHVPRPPVVPFKGGFLLEAIPCWREFPLNMYTKQTGILLSHDDWWSISIITVSDLPRAGKQCSI